MYQVNEERWNIITTVRFLSKDTVIKDFHLKLSRLPYDFFSVSLPQLLIKMQTRYAIGSKELSGQSFSVEGFFSWGSFSAASVSERLPSGIACNDLDFPVITRALWLITFSDENIYTYSLIQHTTIYPNCCQISYCYLFSASYCLCLWLTLRRVCACEKTAKPALG